MVTAPRRHAPGPARPGVHGAGRPGDDELRPAAGLVLLLPLLSAADLQVAGVGVPRHGRHPDDRAHPADRAAVLRRAPRAPAVPPARRDRRPRARRSSRWRAHLEGRDRVRGAGLGGDRRRPALDQGGEAAAGRRGPARSSSPSRAARPATRTTAPAARNLGAPDLTAIGTRNLGIDFQIRHLQVPVVRQSGLADAEVRVARRQHACTISPSSSRLQGHTK